MGDVTSNPADPLRRRLLAAAASSFALVPFAARALQFETPILQTPNNSGPATVADDAALLTVAVQLNGMGPYAFVVDTGADRTVIAEDLVDAVGMARRERVLVQGVVRSTVAETAWVSRLRVGTIERNDLVVPTLPRELLKADGYLGLDVIDGQKVTFDFKNQVVTVGAPRPFFTTNLNGAREELVSARGSAGHLRALDCVVDGVRASAFIDTGAQVSACNSRLLHALMHRKPIQGTSGSVGLSGVTGGRIEGTVTLVDKIQLRDMTLTQCPIVVADFQIFRRWGLGTTPALLIGTNLLQSFAKVSIDYRRKELRFELTDSRAPEYPLRVHAAEANSSAV